MRRVARGGLTARLALLAVVSWGTAVGSTGCGDDESNPGSGGSGGASSSGSTTSVAQGVGGGGAGSSEEVVELRPGVDPLPGSDECVVTITTGIPIPSASHLEPCTSVDYGTNPPSGGDHWRVWASFATYDEPIPREMIVHDLEHGAIAMLYDCDGCEDEVLQAFADVREAHGADEKCLVHGTVSRFVTAPDPELDHPIALAAWGATYVATCIDPESLADFVTAHYAKGPEDICFPGTDPATIECD